MAFNANALVVDFQAIASVKNANIDDVVSKLEASGLKKFLGCDIGYSGEIVSEFFANARIQNGIIISTVKGHEYRISQSFFAAELELPSFGLAKVSNVPNGNMDMWANQITLSGFPMEQQGEKNDLKMEYRWLANIVEKYLLAKAGAFEKITLEKLQAIVLILSAIQVNWSDIIFSFLSEMIKGKSKSQGYAIQICYLLKQMKMVMVFDGLLPSRILNAASTISFIKKNTPEYVKTCESGIAWYPLVIQFINL